MSNDPTVEERLPRRCASCLARHQCLFFSIFSIPGLSAVQAVVEVRVCLRAETILREGDPATGFYIVRSGWIKLFASRPSSGQTVLGIARAGHVLGLLELLLESRLQSSAQALDECELEHVHALDFLEILKKNQHLKTDLLKTAREQIQRNELFHFAGIPHRRP
ncbi:MAG: cyclic nucleotide-binding domain-containing protein [Acidobacteria bacterium]|nr:MAG: cyclic nucleotide-binding domain-containing protein [Acidobacteriota bacterium]